MRAGQKVAWFFRGLRQGWHRLRHSPFGVCGYTHFVQIGRHRGQSFYRSMTCFKDAYHKLPNGQLRCDDHEIFSADTFDHAEFQ